MKIKIGELKRVITETLEPKRHIEYVDFAEIQRRFPDAYRDLISGEWEDDDEQPVVTMSQLEVWLAGDEFFVDELGRLHWYNNYEGDQIWDNGWTLGTLGDD